MKREEKSMQSRNRIINHALQEFAAQGYGLSSINTICSQGDISKGVLYHYFKDRDALYLTCVKRCFDELTDCLRAQVGDAGDHGVQAYFDALLAFFKEHPAYQRLFCDVIIAPPPHLKEAILALKADFDALNVSVLTGMLKGYKLRNGITLEQAIEVFRLFQDFVNTREQMMPNNQLDIVAHEQVCSRSVNILLHGIVEHKEEP